MSYLRFPISVIATALRVLGMAVMLPAARGALARGLILEVFAQPLSCGARHEGGYAESQIMPGNTW